MSENVTEINGTDFLKKIVEDKSAAVVDFWAVWCGPCRALAPLMEQAAKDFAGKVGFYKLNIEESPEIADRYRIRSIPTILFFKNGDIQDQIVGLVSAAQIKAAASKLV